MTGKPYYPSLNLRDLAGLLTLRNQMDAHPDYLTRDDCPYDLDTREQLLRIMATKIVEVPVEVPVDRIVEKIVEKRIEAASDGAGKRGPKQKTQGVDVGEVAREIEEIRTELRQLKLDSKALQVADKIQIIKTRAQLVEKLLAMSERTTNVKKMSGFMSMTMTILDDLIDDDGRQEFMKRIEPYSND